MNKSPVESILRKVNRRWRRVHFWRWVALGLWGALGAAVLLVAADLAWTVGDETRAWARWAMPGALLVALVCYGVWRQRQGRSLERYAMLLETRDPALESHLINAVQFRARGEEPPRGVSSQLVEAEIARGEEAAGHANVRATVEAGPVWRLYGLGAGACLLLLVAHLVYSPILNAVAPRYLDPYGDHPPFSLTTFDVRPGNATVVYGESLAIEVETSGREVEELTLYHRPAGSEAAWDSAPFFLTRTGAFVQKLEDLTAPREYYAGTAEGRSYRYVIGLDLAPRVIEADVVREHPAYTGYASDRRRLRVEVTAEDGEPARFADGVKGLVGTKVTVELESNRPLGQGIGTYNSQEFVLTPAEGDEARVAGKFIVSESGSASFELVDREGRVAAEPYRLQVQAVRDRGPAVEIAEPPVFAMAVPSAKLPARVVARDDVGLEYLTLRIRKAGGEWEARDLAPSRPNAPFSEVEQVVDLASLGAEVGDEIELFATARDNFPGGTQVGKSATHRVRVIAEEAYRQMLAERRTADEIARQYEEALDGLRDLLRQQTDLQEKTRRLAKEVGGKSSDELTDGERQQMAELAEEQQALAESARDLAQQMADQANAMGVTPLEEQMNQEMGGMAEQLRQLSRSEMSRANRMLNQAGQSSPQLALSGANLSQQDAAEQLREMAEGTAQEMEQSLEQLASVMELMNQIAQLQQVYEAQNQITAEAEGYRDEENLSAEQQHDMVRLAEQERQQSRNLERLGERMGQTAGQLQENFPQLAEVAQGIAGAIHQGAIPGQMGEAANQLSAAEAERGYGHARNALEALEELLEKAGECERCLGQDLQGSMAMGGGAPGTGMGSGSFGATLRQLMRNQQQQMAQAGQSMEFPIYGAESPKGGRSSPYSSDKESDELFEEEQEGLAADRVLHLDELTPQDREMLMALKENYPRQYRRYLAGYFRRLAEESGNDGP